MLNRLDNLADVSSGTTKYVQNGYFGAWGICKMNYPDVTGGLTLSYGDQGNDYAGFDRFGRIRSQEWRKDDDSLLDGYSYTYDRAGNRTAKVNLLNSNFSETYAYDALDRLIDTDRGGTDLQDWTLDTLGNWSEFTDDSGTQTRTANAANEITAVSGTWVNPQYDAAGNMATMPQPGDPAASFTATYDAWNRMTALVGSGGTIATYEYDGTNRRIQKTVDGQTEDHYYNENWQLLEVRVDGDTDPREQYVYDIRYVDAPVVRFRDIDTDGTLDDTLYFTNDANFNVTAVIDAGSGDVVERYSFTPYGQRTIMAEDFTGRSSSAFDVTEGHQGKREDQESGLVYNNARYLHTRLGTFTVRDPARYVDGMNFSQYESSNPLIFVDPTGLWTIVRDGRPTATATADKDCDTLKDLAKKALLDENEAAKWMNPFVKESDIKKGLAVEIPNKVYAYRGDVSEWIWNKPGWGQMHRLTQRRLAVFVNDMIARGYDVVWDWDMQQAEVSRAVADPAIQGLFIISHGEKKLGYPIDVDGKYIRTNTINGAKHHGLGFMTFMSCYADKKLLGRGNGGWEDAVSKRGILRIPEGRISPMWSDWYDVRIAYDGANEP